ncbi:hypothetical protein CDCA_CDCA10G3009 [Cyanidium caldarium]|uniref:rRNA adenine N(6)-methyltransferase n=1 Tax=Cyanidium caldarium TaxID=2771 RepID=A0AAV9IXJ3_CYACA|nr:hypothetical protein CDCA_CDCA10G3009 [Cyanidium caldarium]
MLLGERGGWPGFMACPSSLLRRAGYVRLCPTLTSGCSMGPLRSASAEARKPPPSRNASPRLRPKISLGQHFLNDANIARKIVQAVDACAPETLIELGAGTGALTLPLWDKYPDMMAWEVDRRAIEILRGRLTEQRAQLLGAEAAVNAATSELVQHRDALRVNWSQAFATERQRRGRPFITVVGNLPYNIVSQILFGCLESTDVIRHAVFMVQREVAERITAPPRCKDYGVLSVIAQLYSQPRILFPVPRTVFSPVPNVDSAVMRFDFVEPAAVTGLSCLHTAAAVRRVVKLAFHQRRKKLRNNLDADALHEAWADRRAEELSPTEFVELARMLLATEKKRSARQ